MKILKLKAAFFGFLAVMLAGIILTSCEQGQIPGVGENPTELENMALETVVASNTVSEVIVDRIQLFETTDAVPHYFVGIGMSPKAYRLDKKNPAIVGLVQLIKDTEESNTGKPLKVSIDGTGLFVTNVVEASEAEENAWRASAKGKVWDEDVITGEEDISLRGASTTFYGYSEIQDVFNEMNSHRCSFNGYADECIPFDYLIDGCHARAHKMKEILEEEYNDKTCDKLFIYGDPENGNLLKIPGCPNEYWYYHVAPIVKDGYSGEWYAIDPSLGCGLMTVDDWKSRIEGTICGEHHKSGSTYQPRSHTFKNCGSLSMYNTDGNYRKTNNTLEAYKYLSRCEY